MQISAPMNQSVSKLRNMVKLLENVVNLFYVFVVKLVNFCNLFYWRNEVSKAHIPSDCLGYTRRNARDEDKESMSHSFCSRIGIYKFPKAFEEFLFGECPNRTKAYTHEVC